MFRFLNLCVLLALLSGCSATPDKAGAADGAAPAASAAQEDTVSNQASDQGTDQASPGSEAAAADPNEIICKRIVVTGSRLNTRQCRERHIWDELRRQSQTAVKDAQRQGVIGQGPMTKGGE